MNPKTAPVLALRGIWRPKFGLAASSVRVHGVPARETEPSRPAVSQPNHRLTRDSSGDPRDGWHLRVQGRLAIPREHVRIEQLDHIGSAEMLPGDAFVIGTPGDGGYGAAD